MAYMNQKKNGQVQRRKALARRARPSAFASVGGLPRAITLAPSLGRTYRFSRTLAAGVPKSATDRGVAYPFALSDLPDHSDFTNLFMEWRIDSVHCHFIWVPSTAVGPTPRLLFSLDHTAIANPATESALLQRKHTVWTTSPTSRDYCCVVKPRLASAVITRPAIGDSTSNSVAPASTFVSTIEPSAQFNSLLVWFNNFNDALASAGDLNLQFTYNMSFRGVK